jgi:predicted GIY-YIG superfamily endonuclease
MDKKSREDFISHIAQNQTMSRQKFCEEFGFSVRTLEKWQRGERTPESSARAYYVDRLDYYEFCSGLIVAIEREKQIKGWSRKKKQDLINSLNPEWKDLYRSIC